MKSNIKKQLRLLSEGKEGKFTEWCKKNGFEGPNIGCAKKAYDASPEAKKMAVFYMNTVQPKGKDASVLQEAVESEKYTQKVILDINFSGDFYKGKEYQIIDVDDVDSKLTMDLTYDIYIDHKSWGIKGIDVFNISGPKEFELPLYLVDKNSEDTFESVIIPINWDNVSINKESSKGIIALGKNVDINLKNDSKGNLLVADIEVTVYTI